MPQLRYPKLPSVVGYLTVIALAIAPLIVLAYSHASLRDTGTRAFVVFAMIILLSLVILRPVYLVAKRHPSPTKQLCADVRHYSGWLITSSITMLAIAQTLEGVGTIKRLIPQINPYWADPLLINLDRLAFFGNDPWSLSHALLGPIGTFVLDMVYASWHAAMIAFCLVISLLSDRRFQLQAVLTFQLCWILIGNALALIFSSVGPIFVHLYFDRSDFLPLVASLEEHAPRGMTLAYNYLLDAQGTDAFGAGISAMPSMHVSFTVLLALVVGLKFPALRWLAWLFVAATYVGSIHLGWHYASDGLVSGIATIVIWKGANAYLNWLETLRKAPSRQAARSLSSRSPA